MSPTVRTEDLVDAQEVAALLGLARCAVDPLPLEYNLVAVLVPLAAWESLTLRRLPVLSAASTLAALGLLGGRLQTGPATVSALSIAFVLVLAAYLARQAFDAPPASLTQPRAGSVRALRARGAV